MFGLPEVKVRALMWATLFILFGITVTLYLNLFTELPRFARLLLGMSVCWSRGRVARETIDSVKDLDDDDDDPNGPNGHGF